LTTDKISYPFQPHDVSSPLVTAR